MYMKPSIRLEAAKLYDKVRKAARNKPSRKHDCSTLKMRKIPGARYQVPEQKAAVLPSPPPI